MISFRSLLTLIAVLSLASCAGTNTVTTNSAVPEVENATPTTSENTTPPTTDNEAVTRTEISVTASSIVQQPAPTTTSGSKPASTEYEVTKTPESFSAVTVTVENFITKRNLNGAGLIVVDRDNGVRYHNHWGESSTGRISLIASTSKVISAGVLVHLHNQGLLDLCGST